MKDAISKQCVIFKITWFLLVFLMEWKWDKRNISPENAEKDNNKKYYDYALFPRLRGWVKIIPFLFAKFTSMNDPGTYTGMMTEFQSSHSPATITRNSMIVRGEVRAKNGLMSRTPVIPNVVFFNCIASSGCVPLSFLL